MRWLYKAILIVGSLWHVVSATCDDDANNRGYQRDSITGKYYKLFPTHLNLIKRYWRARRICHQQGGQLTTFKTEQDLTSTRVFQGSNAIHVGLTNSDHVTCVDSDCDGKLYWVDGTRFKHHGWMPSINIQSNELCILLHTDGSVQSASCGIEEFMCQINCQEDHSNPTTILEFQELGCYADDLSNRIYPVIAAEGFRQFWDTNGKEACGKHCHALGKPFIGLQYSEECFCGDVPPDPSLLNPTNCDMPCQGNEFEICGGGLRMMVYAISVKCTLPSSNYYQVTGDHFFKFRGGTRSLWDALSECQADGAELPQITNPEEAHALAITRDLAWTRDLWIGLVNPDSVDCTDSSCDHRLKYLISGDNFTHNFSDPVVAQGANGNCFTVKQDWSFESVPCSGMNEQFSCHLHCGVAPKPQPCPLPTGTDFVPILGHYYQAVATDPALTSDQVNQHCQSSGATLPRIQHQNEFEALTVAQDIRGYQMNFVALSKPSGTTCSGSGCQGVLIHDLDASPYVHRPWMTFDIDFNVAGNDCGFINIDTQQIIGGSCTSVLFKPLCHSDCPIQVTCPNPPSEGNQSTLISVTGFYVNDTAR